MVFCLYCKVPTESHVNDTQMELSNTNTIWRYEMNMQEQHDKAKFGKSRLYNRSNSSGVIVTAILALALTLAVVIGVKAVESINEIGTGTMLKVPDDYATIQTAIDFISY